MVHRYYIRCKICNNASILRIQLASTTDNADDIVGSEDDIFFSCKHCEVVNLSKFSARLDSDGPKLSLREDNFLILGEVGEDINTFNTIAVDLPFRADANDNNPDHFSTFIDQMNIIGGTKFIEAAGRIRRIELFSRPMVEKSRLVFFYYEKGRYNDYSKILSEVYRTENVININSMTDNLLSIYKSFVSILDKDDLAKGSQEEIDYLFLKCVENNMSEMAYLLSPDYLGDARRIYIKSLDLLNRVLGLHRALKIGYFIDQYDDNVDLFNTHVSIERFSYLKSVYMETFENFHKSLEYIIIINNILNSKLPDELEGKKYNRKDLRKLSSFNKNKYARSELAEFRSLVDILQMGDNKLRNSIGHFEITVDHSRNTVRVDENISIPYSQMFREFYYSLFVNLASLNISRWIIKINSGEDLNITTTSNSLRPEIP